MTGPISQLLNRPGEYTVCKSQWSRCQGHLEHSDIQGHVLVQLGSQAASTTLEGGVIVGCGYHPVGRLCGRRLPGFSLERCADHPKTDGIQGLGQWGECKRLTNRWPVLGINPFQEMQTGSVQYHFVIVIVILVTHHCCDVGICERVEHGSHEYLSIGMSCSQLSCVEAMPGCCAVNLTCLIEN